MNNSLIRKALSVATAGASIAAYLPDPLAAQVLEYIREVNIMRKILRGFNMNTRTWRKPKRTSGQTAYYIPDGTTATLSAYSATTVEWVAKKLMTYITVDEEAIEDSQPDVIAQVLQDAGYAMGEAEELAFLQGDTTHTATAPTPESATTNNWYIRDARLMFDGIFAVAKSGSAATSVDAASATFDEDMVNEAIYNLGKYGRNKSQLFGLVPSDQAANIRMLDNFKDASKAGLNLASFVTGMGAAGEGDSLVTVIYGVRMYEAPQGPSGEVVIQHRDACEVGDRRRMKMESEKIIESDQRKYVTSERLAFEYNRKDMAVSIINLDSTVSFS